MLDFKIDSESGTGTGGGGFVKCTVNGNLVGGDYNRLVGVTNSDTPANVTGGDITTGIYVSDVPDVSGTPEGFANAATMPKAIYESATLYME